MAGRSSFVHRADEIDLDDRARVELARTPAGAHVHNAVAHPLGHVHALRDPGRRRLVAVEPDRMRRADEMLAGGTAGCEPQREIRQHDEILHDARRRLPRLEHPIRRRGAPAAAGGRDAADVRTERRHPALPDEPAEEHRRAGRRDARVDRAAEPADEADVDGAAAQLRVEPADDESLGAVQLELRLGGRGQHPRPDDPHAHLQTLAFARRGARRGRRGQRSTQERRDDDAALHATLRNQNIDSAPEMSRTTIDPPAKRSVTSRSTVLWPMRVARCAYTWLRAARVRARKNCPPVARATACNVPGLGGTRICSWYPPTRVFVTTPLGVPTSTVLTVTPAAFAFRAAVSGGVRPPSRAPSEMSSTVVGGTTPVRAFWRCPSCAASAIASPIAVPSPGTRPERPLRTSA